MKRGVEVLLQVMPHTMDSLPLVKVSETCVFTRSRRSETHTRRATGTAS
jgi:hypothetical protein